MSKLQEIMKIERHRQKIEGWCSEKGVKPENLEVMRYTTIDSGEISLIGGIPKLGYRPRLAHNI